MRDIEAAGFSIRAASRLYATPAFPLGSGPDYINAVVACETDKPAQTVLEKLHQIEAAHGRVRQARWAGRTLDLDLLAYDDLVLPDHKTYQIWCDLPLEQQKQHAPEEMILPHPRLQDRAFVLVPLNDVAPNWHHPASGVSVKQMLAALPEADILSVKALD